MLHRPLVTLTAVLMLLGPALPAFAGHGGVTVEGPGVTVENQEEQHETLVSVPVEGDASEVGRWLDPIDGEAPAVNLALLPGGKLLYYSGVEANESQDGLTDLQFIWNAEPLPGRSRVLDLSKVSIADDGTITVDEDAVTVPDPEEGGEYDIFCSGTTVTPAGEVVAPGATEYRRLDLLPTDPDFYDAPLMGWEQAVVFDQDTNTWSETPEEMSVPRWYPSALQLPDGDTMVASGIRDLFWPQTYNTLVETYDPTDPEADWEDMDTEFQVAPGVTVDDHELPDTPDTGLGPADRVHRGVPNLPMYPRLKVIPAGPHQGEILYQANGDVWGPFGQHPLQPLWEHFQTLDPDTGEYDAGTWEVHGKSTSGVRNLGTAVPLMLDADDPKPRYLSFGGTVHQSTVATPSAEIIDASEETITSSPTDAMEFPRWSVNGVLLPDGSVLSIGGSVYDNVVLHGSPNIAPLNVERFVPGDGPLGGSWETLPAHEDARAYHSTAVLLPDGSVAVGGHVPLPAFHHHQRHTLGNAQPKDSTFQIYEPAYLFHGDESRPEIISEEMSGAGKADLVAGFGDTVDIPVRGLDEQLDSVTILRPGAATHQYNADQLGVELTVTDQQDRGDGATVLEVQIPDDLALAPGHYMLFVNEDANGEDEGGFYPSEAAWIDLG